MYLPAVQSLPSRMLSHVVSVPVEYIPLAVQPVSSVLVFIMAGSSVPGFLQNFVKVGCWQLMWMLLHACLLCASRVLPGPCCNCAFRCSCSRRCHKA